MDHGVKGFPIFFFLPENISGVKYCQSLIVLQVRDVQVSLEPEDAGVADVCAVEERAEEEEGKDWQDAGVLLEQDSSCQVCFIFSRENIRVLYLIHRCAVW